MLCNGTSHYIEGGGGPDQAALNVLLNMKPYKEITNFAMSEDGYAAQLGTTGPQIAGKYGSRLLEKSPILIDNTVCTSKGIPFAMVHQYQYTPEYLICNFANFDRFYFIDGNNEYMRDHYANHKNKKTKVSAPFDYEEILPYEWVYYQNLDHIKMLEAFCETNKIKLI